MLDKGNWFNVWAELDEYNYFAHGDGINVFIRDFINEIVVIDICITSELYECFFLEILLSEIKYIFCCI